MAIVVPRVDHVDAPDLPDRRLRRFARRLAGDRHRHLVAPARRRGRLRRGRVGDRRLAFRTGGLLMKRIRFILAAVILLAVSAWLMHGKDAVKAEERTKDVRMPR